MNLYTIIWPLGTSVHRTRKDAEDYQNSRLNMLRMGEDNEIGGRNNSGILIVEQTNELLAQLGENNTVFISN